MTDDLRPLKKYKFAFHEILRRITKMPQQQPAERPEFTIHMVLSGLVACCCGCVFGIIAFIFAGKSNKTRSSATAEKQRVSCPHGGRVGLNPPAPSPPSPLAIPMRMAESESHNVRTSYKLSRTFLGESSSVRSGVVEMDDFTVFLLLCLRKFQK